MTRSRALHQAVLVALLLAGSAGAFAQSGRAQAPPREREPREQREELPDSVRRVERETGGEVLRAEPMQRDGHEVYRFKVLTADGRVRVMQDDPNTRRDDRNPRNDRNTRNDEGGNASGNRDGGNGKGGNGNGKEKRPSRDPDGEPQQF